MDWQLFVVIVVVGCAAAYVLGMGRGALRGLVGGGGSGGGCETGCGACPSSGEKAAPAPATPALVTISRPRRVPEA